MFKINNISPKLSREGSQLCGTNASGADWYLWLINDKYDMFSNSPEPPVEIGKEYDLEVETKVNGKFTNYTLKQRKATSRQDYVKPEIQPEERREVQKDDKQLEELKKIVSNIEELVIGMESMIKEILDNSKKN